MSEAIGHQERIDVTRPLFTGLESRLTMQLVVGPAVDDVTGFTGMAGPVIHD